MDRKQVFDKINSLCNKYDIKDIVEKDIKIFNQPSSEVLKEDLTLDDIRLIKKRLQEKLSGY